MKLLRIGIPAAVVVAASCGPVSSPGLGPDVRRELARGGDAAIVWITQARSRSDVDEVTSIAVGYMERLRLGFGSPFRLIEIALNDPRLPDSTRTRLGWALLSRTLSRNAYQFDPVALDRIGLHQLAPAAGSGRMHLELIDGAIRQSADPRTGELAVRLAYMLASASGDVGSGAPDVAARAASLIRDRELARIDVSRLLREASDSGADPLALLPRWRQERRFDVERPTMGVLASDAELNAMQVAPLIARAVRELSRTPVRDVQSRITPRPPPLLGPAAAVRLLAASDSFDIPPSAPVAVAVMLQRDELIDPPWIAPDEKEARRRFVELAYNEERFVAAYAQLRARSIRDAGPPSVALGAAVALRASAQEPLWLPGQPGPSVRELQERFGLATVAFGDDVPAAWRPYYRRLLSIALSDLRLVLPALDLRGLNVVFTDMGRREATLALHDPRSRRLVLPPHTAIGTLAHEIAHDLDWQIALRRYRVRGDYASDRAVRLAAGDRFSEKMQDLADNSQELRPSPDRAAHSNRPAEVFARNMDWFVAASLASKGRVDGYLSSVQDEILTGYGSVRSPDISGNAGHTLISILDEVAPLYPETREWFVRNYGRDRALTPTDLVRRVIDASDTEAPAPIAMNAWLGEERFESVEAARDAGFAAIDQWVCGAPGAYFFKEYELARRELVLAAAQARSRGIALQLARGIGGRMAETWMARRIDGERGPFSDSPDEAVREVLQPILDRALHAGTAELPEAGARIDVVSPPVHCAAGPFRITTIF